MSKMNDNSTSLAGGGLDVSRDSEIDEREGTAVDDALARRHQVEERVRALEEVKKSREPSKR